MNIFFAFLFSFCRQIIIKRVILRTFWWGALSNPMWGRKMQHCHMFDMTFTFSLLFSSHRNFLFACFHILKSQRAKKEKSELLGRDLRAAKWKKRDLKAIQVMEKNMHTGRYTHTFIRSINSHGNRIFF